MLLPPIPCNHYGSNSKMELVVKTALERVGLDGVKAIKKYLSVKGAGKSKTSGVDWG